MGRNALYALLPSARHSVGWLQTSDDTTIPLEERASFVTIRRNAMGTYKVVSTYPLTKDGWQQACQELAALEPSAMPMLRKLLAHRIEEDAARAAEMPPEPPEPWKPMTAAERKAMTPEQRGHAGSSGRQ